MEHFTGTFAKAFGISSHLFRFHQITQSTILTEHAPERSDPSSVFQAATLCELLFHSLRISSSSFH